MDTELRVTRQRLHDGLCQQLTGAAMFARVVMEGMKARQDPNAEHAEKLLELINGAVEEVQAIMSGAAAESAESGGGE